MKCTLILVLMLTSPVMGQTIEECTRHLKDHGIAPAQYVVDKFKSHDLVILGEDHAIKQNLDFVAALIPVLHKNGVYNLGMEFGAEEKQAQLDSIVSARTYNVEAAREAMYFYNVGWAYEEYYGLCEKVWQFNQTLPPGAPRFRIVNLSYQYDWSHFKQGGTRTDEVMKNIFPRGTPDQFRALVVEKEIISRKQKALLLVGTPHAYTRYATCHYDFLRDNFIRCDSDWLGQRLLRQYGSRVTNILLHQPFPNMPGKQPYLVSPGNGMIEQVMSRNGYTQVGFDLGDTPMGKIPDRSLHSIGYSNFTLGQYFDGYIFLAPLRQLTGCTVDQHFFATHSWDEIRLQIPDPDWRAPIHTLSDFQQQIRDYVNVKQRYATALAGEAGKPSK